MAHNAIYRGNDITDLWTSGDYSQQVEDGTFDDIFPGDYIIKTKTINGTTYSNVKDVIVGCNIYMDKYISDDVGGYVSTNHCGITPRTSIGTSYMNSTNTTEGGFYNSYMYQTVLPLYLTGYQNAYGSSHLLQFGNLISYATNTSATSPGYSGWSGTSSAWAWYETYITLFSEVQVYGASVWGGGFDVGEGRQQLPMFIYEQNHNFSHSAFWLRAVASSTYFAYARGYGSATYDNASSTYSVRPLLLLY